MVVLLVLRLVLLLVHQAGRLGSVVGMLLLLLLGQQVAGQLIVDAGGCRARGRLGDHCWGCSRDGRPRLLLVLLLLMVVVVVVLL